MGPEILGSGRCTPLSFSPLLAIGSIPPILEFWNHLPSTRMEAPLAIVGRFDFLRHPARKCPLELKSVKTWLSLACSRNRDILSQREAEVAG
jgi:hypothetical protein